MLLVKSQGLEIKFDEKDVQVYSRGIADVVWPSRPDPSEAGDGSGAEWEAFAGTQFSQKNWGFDIEGRCTRGIWRRYKQAEDGGSVTVI